MDFVLPLVFKKILNNCSETLYVTMIEINHYFNEFIEIILYVFFWEFTELKYYHFIVYILNDDQQYIYGLLPNISEFYDKNNS